jgi:hypothetical protein
VVALVVSGWLTLAGEIVVWGVVLGVPFIIWVLIIWRGRRHWRR